MAADDYALAVGIARYPGLSNLQGPENDAGRFHEWLVSPCGGDVPENQAFLVLSSHFGPFAQRRDARPIIQDILNHFECMIETGKQRGGRAGRRLYIFMAGHGFSPTLEEAALLMANANMDSMGYHIPSRTYALWFIASALFDEIVLLMDCCRDDYPYTNLALPPWGMIHAARAYKVRHLYGFATKWSRKSRERVIAEGGEIRGLFTWSLLKGLQGGAVDQQGRTTGASLKNFVHNYLPKLLPQDQYQEPNFEGDEDIVFTQGRPVSTTHVLITFGQLAQHATAQLFNASFDLKGQHAVKDGTWEVDLEPGIYRLLVPCTGQKLLFEVIGGGVINVPL